MKVRSITYFVNPQFPTRVERLDAARCFLAEARPAFEAAGYEVQTTRLAGVEPDGFAAPANVPPGAPFFPAAYR